MHVTHSHEWTCPGPFHMGLRGAGKGQGSGAGCGEPALSTGRGVQCLARGSGSPARQATEELGR